MGTHDVDDFDRQVIERSREIPVLVDFWAEWCGPCRMLGPVLETLAADAGDRWELAKVDTEAQQAVAERYGIRGIPAVKLFVDGEVVDEFVGALPESEVRAFLDRAIPGRGRKLLQRARQLLTEGDRQGAIDLLEQAVAQDDDPEARVELAGLLLWQAPDRSGELVEGIGVGAEQGEAAEAIRTVRRLFDLLDSPDELPQSESRTTYLSAIAALRGGDVATALDGLIDVIGRDRGYDEDGARRACLAIFRILGEDSEVTRSYRPLFASSVYA